MRTEKLVNLVHLAIQLQGRVGGMTINDIEQEFGVSRRTAERMRNAVEDAFGPLLPVETSDKKRHWRLQTNSLRGLIQLTPEEFVEIESSASNLDRSGLSERSSVLRELATKLRASQRPIAADGFEDDFEMLMQAEGLAMHPLPRSRIEPGLLRTIRRAIKGTRTLAFEYVSSGSGRRSQKQVEPYGVIYGNRPYLVAQTESSEFPQLWLLTNMSNVKICGRTFSWNDEFSLREFAERSFGVYQEKPFDVELLFDANVAQGASNFMFHPSQKLSQNDDGSLTVRFTAGGIVEMCWHLVTWGTSVKVLRPSYLREYLTQMCNDLADHHSEPVV